MSNQEQLFAEGIEGMSSVLLCTRENIKTDKNEVTGKQKVSCGDQQGLIDLHTVLLRRYN